MNTERRVTFSAREIEDYLKALFILSREITHKKPVKLELERTDQIVEVSFLYDE